MKKIKIITQMYYNFFICSILLTNLIIGSHHPPLRFEISGFGTEEEMWNGIYIRQRNQRNGKIWYQHINGNLNFSWKNGGYSGKDKYWQLWGEMILKYDHEDELVGSGDAIAFINENVFHPLAKEYGMFLWDKKLKDYVYDYEDKVKLTQVDLNALFENASDDLKKDPKAVYELFVGKDVGKGYWPGYGNFPYYQSFDMEYLYSAIFSSIKVENVKKLDKVYGFLKTYQESYQLLKKLEALSHKRNNGGTWSDIREEAYSIFGLEADADKEDLKKVYRNLSLQYHPDKAEICNKLATEICKEFNDLNDFSEENMLPKEIHIITNNNDYRHILYDGATTRHFLDGTYEKKGLHNDELYYIREIDGAILYYNGIFWTISHKDFDLLTYYNFKYFKNTVLKTKKTQINAEKLN